MSASKNMNPTGPEAAEMQSALFAQLVMQLSNMAFMLLGKVPHPESGKSVRDLQSARMFIDQLEMLEAKTKGNLSASESGFLRQSLMSVRMAFVEAAGEPSPSQGGCENKTAPAGQADAVKES